MMATINYNDPKYLVVTAGSLIVGELEDPGAARTGAAGLTVIITITPNP